MILPILAALVFETPALPPVCEILVNEGNAYAEQVIPGWPEGMAAPTEEQADAIFAADGAGDPDAMAAMDRFGEAVERGCW